MWVTSGKKGSEGRKGVDEAIKLAASFAHALPEISGPENGISKKYCWSDGWALLSCQGALWDRYVVDRSEDIFV